MKNVILSRAFVCGRLPQDDLDEILDRARKMSEYAERAKFCRTIAFVEKQKRKEEK
jgi:hypothetical protein